VSEVLKLLYRKDREFQSWLSDQHANNRKPTMKEESIQLEESKNRCSAASNSACVRTQLNFVAIEEGREVAFVSLGIFPLLQQPLVLYTLACRHY
jgi:hypothetical protein